METINPTPDTRTREEIISISKNKLDILLKEGTEDLKQQIALIFKDVEIKAFGLNTEIMKALLEGLDILAKNIRGDVNKSLKEQKERGCYRSTPGICFVQNEQGQIVTDSDSIENLPSGYYIVNARAYFNTSLDALLRVKKCFKHSGYLQNKVIENLENLLGNCEIENLHTNQGDRADAVIFNFDLKIN